MSIQNLILGNLVSRGADKLLNPDRINKNQFNLLTGGGPEEMAALQAQLDDALEKLAAKDAE